MEYTSFWSMHMIINGAKIIAMKKNTECLEVNVEKAKHMLISHHQMQE
jgi:hypothetical protein